MNLIKDIDNLIDSASVTFKTRNFIPIPPFLLDNVNEVTVLSDGDVILVLLKAVKGVKSFDVVNSTNPKFKEKSKVKI